LKSKVHALQVVLKKISTLKKGSIFFSQNLTIQNYFAGRGLTEIEPKGIFTKAYLWLQ